MPTRKGNCQSEDRRELQTKLTVQLQDVGGLAIFSQFRRIKVFRKHQFTGQYEPSWCCLAPQIGSNGLPLAAQMRDNPPPSTRGGRTAGLLGVNSFHCPADKARSSTGGTPPGYGHAACPVTTCGARKRCSPCSPFSGTFSTRAEADVGG